MSRLNATSTLLALSLPTQRDEESGLVESLRGEGVRCGGWVVRWCEGVRCGGWAVRQCKVWRVGCEMVCVK